jgi:hypothetical protein
MLAIAIFYSTPLPMPVHFKQSQTIEGTGYRLNKSLSPFYAEQTISKRLHIYFMKHIHNQAERRSRQSKEMPQTYLLPACG